MNKVQPMTSRTTNSNRTAKAATRRRPPARATAMHRTQLRRLRRPPRRRALRANRSRATASSSTWKSTRRWRSANASSTLSDAWSRRRARHASNTLAASNSSSCSNSNSSSSCATSRRCDSAPRTSSTSPRRSRPPAPLPPAPACCSNNNEVHILLLLHTFFYCCCWSPLLSSTPLCPARNHQTFCAWFERIFVSIDMKYSPFTISLRPSNKNTKPTPLARPTRLQVQARLRRRRLLNCNWDNTRKSSTKSNCAISSASCSPTRRTAPPQALVRQLHRSIDNNSSNGSNRETKTADRRPSRGKTSPALPSWSRMP